MPILRTYAVITKEPGENLYYSLFDNLEDAITEFNDCLDLHRFHISTKLRMLDVPPVGRDSLLVSKESPDSIVIELHTKTIFISKESMYV